ncbi:MAG: alpha/beta hydrolase [Deltaproteobacteria bacterium]|nr:alpha/beta hydrolase [Deltaproteobacteria bacterium]
MKVKKTTLNGIRHQIYTWGNTKNPKLFFVHGWLDTGASFQFIAEILKKDFYCIALDLRGYGQSEHGKNPLGYFFYEYVADVHALFQHFSPNEPVKVIGHSLGGAIMGIYAGTFPERVSHFINLEGFAFRDNPIKRGPEKLRTWITHLNQARFNTFRHLEDYAQRLMQANPALTLERALQIAPYLSQKTNGKITPSADPLHKLADPYVFNSELIYSFWKKITASCLLIWAEKTNMNDWMKSKNLKQALQLRMKAFKKRRVVQLKDCGHMMHHEKPEEVAILIHNFLVPKQALRNKLKRPS